MCFRPLNARQRRDGAKYCSNTCMGDAYRGLPRPNVSRRLKGTKRPPEVRAKLSAIARSRPRRRGQFINRDAERELVRRAKLSAIARKRRRKEGRFAAKMQES